MRDACDIERLNAYLDQDLGDLSESEKFEIEAHLQNCPHCQAYLEDLQLLREGLGNMPLKALPEHFEDELHSRLVEASQSIVKKSSRVSHFVQSTSFKVFSGVAAVLLIAVVAMSTLGGPYLNDVFRGLGSKSEESVSAEPASSPPMDSGTRMDNLVAGGSAEGKEKGYGDVAAQSPTIAPVPEPAPGEPSGNAYDPSIYGKMIIRNGAIALEVEKFDEAYTNIEAIVAGVKGYIENADTYTSPYYENNVRKGDYKGGNLTVRVPNTQFDQVMKQLKTIGNVTQSNISSNDITESYIDTESRIRNLEARELRLRELLVKAESVKDIMEVDLQLANVRTEIDSLKGILKSYEKSLHMSSITINLFEKKLSETNIEGLDGNLFDRIKASLIRSINSVIRMMQSALVGLFAFLPFAIVLLGIGFLIFKVIRKWIRAIRRT